MEQTISLNRVADQARDLITKANSIVLIGHINADGDALGSVLALGQALKKIGKRIEMVMPDTLPITLSFLPGYQDVIGKPQHIGPADLIIALDSADLGRFGDVYTHNTAFFQSTPILNIDHHYSNELFGTVNWIDADAAATAEPVYQLLRHLGVEFDYLTSTCLLAAIVADTRWFRTSNTTPRTLMIATALMETSAPLVQIGDWLFNSKKISTLLLWAKVLGTLDSSGGLVWAEVTPAMLKEVGAQPEETDDLVSFIGGVRDANVSLLFHENSSGTIKVSMRSSGEVNVSEIAAHFGGGGHPKAAGCSLPGDLNSAKEAMLSYLRRSMERQQANS